MPHMCPTNLGALPRVSLSSARRRAAETWGESGAGVVELECFSRFRPGVTQLARVAVAASTTRRVKSSMAASGGLPTASRTSELLDGQLPAPCLEMSLHVFQPGRRGPLYNHRQR